jgi:hypothetical protein
LSCHPNTKTHKRAFRYTWVQTNRPAYEGGPHRIDVHICTTQLQRKNTQPPSFASMDRTYGDALCSRDWAEALLQLWQGGHTGRHISVTLKGPSQLGESLWNPSRFSTCLRTRSPTLSSLLCTNRWWYRLSAWLYCAFRIAARHLRSSMKSTSSRRSCSYIDSSKDWTRGEPIMISRGRHASAL